MKRDPARLGLVLVGIQLGVHATTFLLAALFAPRVLLLEPAAARGALVVIAAIGGFTVLFSTITTVVFVRRVRSTLNTIARGANVAKKGVFALYAIPARLALAKAARITLANGLGLLGISAPERM